MKGRILTKIPAELVSAADHGVVVSADGVYDYINEKNQEVINSEKADKSATVSTVEYDSSRKKFTKTIDGVTTDIVDIDTVTQDAVPDLAIIRSGAAAGATAYLKPNLGIPKTDLSESVLESLNKADNAAPQVTTYTKNETDALLALKENNLTFDQTPTINSTNPVTSGGIKAAIDTEASSRSTRDSELYNLIVDCLNSLLNYYLKTETYNKSEILNLLDNIVQFKYQLAEELPVASSNTVGWIYLIPAPHPKSENTKEEYITIVLNGNYSWEHIGSTNVDLSGYSTTELMNTVISQALTSYYTKVEADALLAAKLSNILDLDTIRSGAAAGATAYLKPTNGIPSSDFSAEVQNSLALADTALLEHLDISGKANRDINAIEGNVAMFDSAGNPTDSGAAMLTIVSGATAGSTAYQLPNGGIPKSDLSSNVQTSLDSADSAYQLPQEGMPKSDLTIELQDSIDLANSAYLKPINGIPSADMTQEVQTSLEKADIAYQLPANGMPSTDMTQSVLTSLNLADTAYLKPNLGIPKSDLTLDIQASLNLADTSYLKPNSGIPNADLTSEILTSLGKADTAYLLPSTGMPKTDLAESVLLSLDKANTAYQKPSTGISSEDLDSSVNLALNKANTAYQKDSNGIPSTDMTLSVQTSLGKADTAILPSDLATVATTGSYNDLNNKPSIPPFMAVLKYGASTWEDFIAAYSLNAVVYCRASSGSNPASGSLTRMAFLAYVNNETNPTEAEFQYYRSVASHSDSQLGDLVYVYKLKPTNGGTWEFTVRSAFSKVVAGTNMTSSYSNGTITLNGPTNVSDLTNDSGYLVSTDILGKADKVSNGTSGNIVSLDSNGNIQDSGQSVSTLAAGAAAGSTAYQLPSGGIPSTDMSSAVLASLALADSAVLDVSNKAEKSETVSAVTYDTTNKKFTKTINGITTDVVSIPTIKGDLNLSKTDVSLGNVTNDALVKRSEMGVASGVATLDLFGKIPSSQLPSFVDDVVEGYYYGGSFYSDSSYVNTITPEGGKIYVDVSTNITYRWGGSTYAVIGSDLAIGTTQGTAADGKVVNDHVTNSDIHVTTNDKSTWNAKQDAINDLNAIRSGASAGSTAYLKPSGGIPSTDMSSAVQTSLGKADTALQSFTETDPTVPSWAKLPSKPSYTKSEIGLGNVDNTADADKSVNYANTAGSAPASDVYSWAKLSSKPSYTKSEIGLGNVDNTADADKSVNYANSSGYASSAGSSTYTRYVIGDDNAASPGYALLLSGSGRVDLSPSGDTWIYWDTLGGTSSPWGIRHDLGDNNIGFFGAGTETSYINLTSGVSYGYGYYHRSYGSSAYVLTSDGGAAHIGSMSVNYANSAGSAPASDVYSWAKQSTKPTYTAAEVGALRNYGEDNSRPNGTTFSLPGGVNAVLMRSGATSGGDIGIFHLSDDNAFVCNSSDNGYLFAAFDTDRTADFSTPTTASFAVLSDGAGATINNNTVMHGGNIGSYAIANLGGDGGSIAGFYNTAAGNQSYYWGFNGSSSNTYAVPNSSMSVGYASSSGNSDTVDNLHESSFQRAVTSTQRDFTYGTLITTDIDYNVSSGNPFYMEIKGNTYSRFNSCFTQVQGYIYDDTIIHYGVTHLGVSHIDGIIAMNIDGKLCFWFPRQTYWEGYSIAVYSAFNYRVNRILTVTDAADPGGTKRVNLSDNTQYAITTSNIGNLSVNYANSAGYSSNAGSANSATYSSVLYLENIVSEDTAIPNDGTVKFYKGGTSAIGGDGHIIGFGWYDGNYGAQLFIDTDPTYAMSIRQRDSSGNFNAWKYIVTEANIGSQSVSYATSAGSASSATYATNDSDGNTISSTYLKKSGGTMTGPLTVNHYIFSYNYTNGDNLPDFVFDKPGLNYTGIGSNGEYDTIYFGATTITDGQAAWVTSYKQKWKFNGTIYQEDNAVIHAGNIGSQSVNYASSAGNADTVDGLHVHSDRNNEANKIVRTDGNGFLQCGYISSSSGDEANNSSPARVWGTNGSDSYLRTYLTSALNVGSSDRATRLGTIASSPDNSHPGYGANVFYSWGTGNVGNSSDGYSVGITIGAHPNDQNYGFLIVQNLWDDNLYTRRYTSVDDTGSWQTWKTLINDSNIGNYAITSHLDISGKVDKTSSSRPGVYRLYRRDDESAYNLLHHWTGSYWYLRGYYNDDYHAGVLVDYANYANLATNNVEKLDWWRDTDSHNADDLVSGVTFAYSNHNAPTTGVIASFSGTHNSYQLQLQGSYSSDYLYFRNKNGDNGSWNPWRYVIHNGNIGSQSVSYATSAGSASSASYATYAGYISRDAGLSAIFREDSYYRSGIYYNTYGNESVVFANNANVTSWMFASTNPDSCTDWTTLTPSLQIKNQQVAINKLIPNGGSLSYNLDVNGSANATTLYENGSRVITSSNIGLLTVYAADFAGQASNSVYAQNAQKWHNYSLSVVSSMPASPDSNTIYIVVD